MMPYKADPLSEKLDKVAEATGFPQFSNKVQRSQPVRFRFVPVVLLACGIGGIGIQIGVSELAGYLIVMLTFLGTLVIQPFSPLRKRGPRFDEREAALAKSGHLTGLIAAMSVAYLGCVVIGLGVVATQFRFVHFWAPDSATDWFSLAMLLLVIQANAALLAGSAKLPATLKDDEDDEDDEA